MRIYKPFNKVYFLSTVLNKNKKQILGSPVIIRRKVPINFYYLVHE